MDRIFYLENDENDYLLLDLAMRKVGAPKSVRWFKTSAQLKRTLLELSPDQYPGAIVVDLKLDGEYGTAMIDWLAQQPLFRHIPAFIFSSGRIMEEVAEALEKNAAGYLFKPSRLENWLEIARQLKEITDRPGFLPSAQPDLNSARQSASR
jgi:CheY-like chemotaxis protein